MLYSDILNKKTFLFHGHYLSSGDEKRSLVNNYYKNYIITSVTIRDLIKCSRKAYDKSNLV